MESHEPLAQFLSDLRIHGRERLVQQENVRPRGQGAGNGHALALAAGQLMGIALEQAPAIPAAPPVRQRGRRFARGAIS